MRQDSSRANGCLDKGTIYSTSDFENLCIYLQSTSKISFEDSFISFHLSPKLLQRSRAA